MTSALRALIFLIPIVAWAPPAGAPEPTVDDVIQQQITRRAMELIQQSNPRNAGSNSRNAGKPTPAMLASEAEAVKQAVAEALAKPAAAIAAPPAAIPAPPVTSAAIPAPPAAIAPVVVTAPTMVSIPAEIRDLIVSICVTLITGGIATGLAWMRAHLAFMKEAGANAAITKSANDLGTIAAHEIVKQGKSLSSISISDPIIASAAQDVIAAYPQWGPIVGLTLDIAKRKVLAGAIQQSAAPIVSSAAPAAPARQNSAEPGATPPPPPAAPAPTVSVTPPAAGVTIVTAEAAPTTVPTPPMDLEVHP